jgi:tetratricopeptide (TPR) repeat protein
MAKRITEYINETGNGGAAEQRQLRQLLERYPYYQAARLLLLRSLYENHDPSFGQELRKAAIYIPSRRVLYNLIEGERLKPTPDSGPRKVNAEADDAADRTYSLIDDFLTTLPEVAEPKPTNRKRPMADASTDYISYMMQIEEDSQTGEPQSAASTYGQPLLDSFLEQGRIVIQEQPDDELQKPEIDSEMGADSQIFTETLARIYIKQGKFDKALEIIRQLSLNYPKKNRYFADQIRYLEKIIVNNNNKIK